MSTPSFKIEPLTDVATGPLLDRAEQIDPEVEMAVRGIEQLIRRDGDAALMELTKRLDGATLKQPFLQPEKWAGLAAECDDDLRRAIDANLARIEQFHAAQSADEETMEIDGIQLGRRPVPYDGVGCYVPGGRANYPSSVLMTVAPARIAGVKRIIVATPPNRDGDISPAVAYAAKAAGATDILLAGGAQAVFALALGTSHIPVVQAIVGPGNAYVTEAKRWVTGLVHTDAPAGPSELVVLADADAPADAIAWDLMAQAEHDPDARVVLVTPSDDLARAVITEIKERLPEASRSDIMSASLEKAAFLVGPMDQAIAFVNDYAPEHLSIMMADDILDQITNAGSIFIGPSTPVSLGDYGSGTNHVLPTMGHAKLRGGLAVEDFRKWITWQRASPEGLRNVSKDIITVARAEGLDYHAEAVERRLK